MNRKERRTQKKIGDKSRAGRSIARVHELDLAAHVVGVEHAFGDQQLLDRLEQEPVLRQRLAGFYGRVRVVGVRRMHVVVVARRMLFGR